MGIIRKTASVASLGTVNFKSKKEAQKQADKKAQAENQRAAKKQKKSNDYTRVCKKCHKARLLHRSAATMRKPSAVALNAGRLASDMAVGPGATRKHTSYLADQATFDRYIAAATCPSCGSTDFFQYAPGKAPAKYQ